ncbi:MAG: J domain-containing protein [Terriglobia bacterium]
MERRAATPKYTHYELLGVPANATGTAIRQRFRELVKKYHPDVTPGVEGNRFREITEAYRVLSNPRSRKAYDRELKEPQEGSVSPTATTPAP